MASASGASLFSSPDGNQLFLTFSAIYFVVCYFSLFAWAVLGDKVTIILNSQLRVRCFNALMGGTLIATACYLLYTQVVAPTV
jgi:threonine/homoserine/homoserine lactone efflux protein